ncbi:hypothetical protein FB451DRAFT_1427204 [Mycena latifolia]|nr:hypothetical protein FB451DRAFT_1427204 [Mycena latifolia]
MLRIPSASVQTTPSGNLTRKVRTLRTTAPTSRKTPPTSRSPPPRTASASPSFSAPENEDVFGAYPAYAALELLSAAAARADGGAGGGARTHVGAVLHARRARAVLPVHIHPLLHLPDLPAHALPLPLAHSHPSSSASVSSSHSPSASSSRSRDHGRSSRKSSLSGDVLRFAPDALAGLQDELSMGEVVDLDANTELVAAEDGRVEAVAVVAGMMGTSGAGRASRRSPRRRHLSRRIRTTQTTGRTTTASRPRGRRRRQEGTRARAQTRTTLAQRIPSALVTHHTIRREERREREARRALWGGARSGDGARSRQTTLRPAGAGVQAPLEVAPSTREAALQAEASMPRARQRSQMLPGNASSTSVGAGPNTGRREQLLSPAPLSAT